MNWKKYKELFATDKFGVRCKLATGVCVDSENIQGIKNSSFIVDIRKFEDGSNIYPYEVTHLIARPRSDMSDEEVRYVLGTDLYSDEYAREVIDNRCESGALGFTYFLRMRDIGVYPFADNDEQDIVWRHINEKPKEV